MSTDVVSYQPPSMPAGQELRDMVELANQLGRSGFFKDASDGTKALAKLAFGRDLGLSATAAMTGIHIVEGKPEISANVHAQMVRTYIGPEGERYDYKVVKHSDTECKIEFFRRRTKAGEWERLGDSHYTKTDADRAGLSGRPPWKKHPRNMFFARAMTDGVAFHCPEVTNGIRVYHEDEVQAGVDQRAATPVSAGTSAEPEVEIADADVVTDPLASPEQVDGLVLALTEASAPNEPVRLYLTDELGVGNVPSVLVREQDGIYQVNRAALAKLTVEHADRLLAWVGGDGDPS